MVRTNRPSIEDLQRQIAEEKSKIKKSGTRRQLTSELAELKRGQKLGVKLSRRFVRGAKVLGKKTGKALATQGRLIQERNERDAIARRKSSRKFKKGLPKKVFRSNQQIDGFDFMKPLDF